MAVPDKKMLDILSPFMMRAVLIPSRQLGKSYAYGGTVAKNVPKIESAGVRLGEVTAWRLWRIDGYHLKSIARDVTWLPGVPMTGDPKPTNTAGIYAFRDPADAYREMDHYNSDHYNSNTPPMVLGTVKLWGRYVEHERGYRAEFARITSLVASSRWTQIDLGALRSLYLGRRCPPGLTPVVDQEGGVVGVTSLRSSQPPDSRWDSWSGRYVEKSLPPVTVCEPTRVITSYAYLEAAHRAYPKNMTTSYQYHHWRGGALLLEPGQDPTWLPGWLPLPVEKDA